MLKQTLGFTIMCIGGMSADSDSLVIPLACLVIALMLIVGNDKGDI